MIDLGGQWGGETRIASRACNELGLERFPVTTARECWFGTAKSGGRHGNAALQYVLLFEADQIQQPAEQVANAKKAKAFRAIAASVDPARPWTTPNAAELDHTTIRSWCEKNSDSRLSDFELEWLSVVGGSGGFDP